MWIQIEKILSSFKSSFSRVNAYKWFVVIVVGFMVRSDKLGMTSVIRDLSLRPDTYECMMHFFRANSWSLDKLRSCWKDAVKKYAPTYQIFGRYILPADGVKQSKEGHYMPGVKRMAQESETQSKADMIHGHLWGCVGILTGTSGNLSCTPLSMRIHDGLQVAAGWTGSCLSSASHVIQVIQNVCEAAQHFGKSYALLDRYFLSVPALLELRKLNRKNQHRVDAITKAKRSAVAYKPAPPRPEGSKGRPRIKGDKVKLADLFDTHSDYFIPAKIWLYGKPQDIRYYSVQLLWGQKLYQKLLFVLVEYGGTRSILVSTDLELRPLSVIHLYSYRFRIENCFRELKQWLGGFSYHFWTKAMGRLSHFRKKTDPDPLEGIESEKGQERVLKTIRATEMYALLSNIAMGILQMLSADRKDKAGECRLRYQRTPGKERPSEANVMYVLQRRILSFLEKYAENEIASLIRSVQLNDSVDKDQEAA